MRLAQELTRVVGARYVLYTPEDLLVFENDASIDRALPDIVVLPSSTEEVSQVLRLAHQEGVPVVPRGAGTGFSGGAVASEGGILIVLTRMNRILEIDPLNLLAVVEPGVVNLELSQAVLPHNLFYAPDPSSQKVCTLGGNVANNSGGPHCLLYGVTVNHIQALEVVLQDGEVVWLGGPAPDRPGYDLVGAFVGSEGTMGIVTKIVVRLLRRPERTRTFLAIFTQVDQASQTVSEVVAAGILPAALEMMDRLTVQAVEAGIHAGYPPDAGAVLLIEVEGLGEQLEGETELIQDICYRNGAREVRRADIQAERDRLWAGRKGALGALGRLAPNYYILDGVVPRSQLPQVLRQVYRIVEKYGLQVANVSTPATVISIPTSSSTAGKPGRPSGSSRPERRSCVCALTQVEASRVNTVLASRNRSSCPGRSLRRTWRRCGS